MKLAIMQPYLFPYIGYFQLISTVDLFIIYDDVQFIKNGWINRNRYLVDEEAHLFTFGIKKDSTFKNINERLFATNHDYHVMKFLKFLTTNYRPAPFFSIVYDLVEEIMSFEDLNVARKIHFSLVTVCKYLEITTDLLVSSSLSTSGSLSGQDRVIEICRTVGSNFYVNSIGGRELYNSSVFEANGIRISFLKTLPLPYNQFGGAFVPNLSIIDVMMFNSISEIQGQLKAYSLI